MLKRQTVKTAFKLCYQGNVSKILKASYTSDLTNQIDRDTLSCIDTVVFEMFRQSENYDELANKYIRYKKYTRLYREIAILVEAIQLYDFDDKQLSWKLKSKVDKIVPYTLK